MKYKKWIEYAVVRIVISVHVAVGMRVRLVLEDDVQGVNDARAKSERSVSAAACVMGVAAYM